MSALDRERLLAAYRTMLLARGLDDREILLKRQNRIYFQISGAGHEAIGVAAGLALRAGVDWVFPYYRDRALCLMLGVTAHDMMLQAVGASVDPASGGRQMPSHWSAPQLRIVSASSPTGTQYTQAVGCAQASRMLAPEAREVTLVCSGDGATSEGEFWEAVNAACLDKLPVVFLVEDNGYAISVPVEHQTAGGNISQLLAGFPGLLRVQCDGTDVPASHDAMERAVEWCREGQGPALVHAMCTRLYSHSLSDDETLYKTAVEREAEAARDPVIRFPEWLLSEGHLDRHAMQRIAFEVEQEVETAADKALDADAPPEGSALRWLYSDRVDARGGAFATEPHMAGEPRTMVDTINRVMHEEMARNPRIVVFGEDVADCSREVNLPLVKGKGGVFKATQGLQRT
ncbi:MAG: dehydrogenase, partial [Bryobacterales bacterium]|nr:dehydrogenase [Bryobacterales bacterium]